MKTKLLLLLTLTLNGTFLFAQWTVQNSGFTAASRGIKGISVVDANVVWAIAYDGSGSNVNVQEFTKTTNGGTTWTPGTINVGNTGSGIAMVHAESAQIAWAVAYPNATGQPQGIFKTTNGGTNWTKQTTATFTGADGFANVVYFWDLNNGFCMGDPNGGYFEIYTTTNGGTNWTRVPLANIPANLSGEYGYVGQVVAVGDTVFFTTNKGRIYKSINRGTNWTVVQSPLTDFGSELSSGEIAFKDNNNGYIVNNEGFFYVTSDGGANWDLIFPDSGFSYGDDVCVIPGTDTVMTTGVNSSLSGSSYTNNNGQTYTMIDNIQHTDVQFFDASTGWAGGFNTSATVGGMFKWSGPAFLGTSDNLLEKGFTAYPNPVINTLQMRANEIIDSVVIYNLLGQEVYASQPGVLTHTIDMSLLPHGTYIAKIGIDNIEGSVKIIR